MNLAAAQQALLARGFDYLDPSRATLMLNTGKDTFEDIYEWPWLQATITAPTPLVLDDLKLVMSVTDPATTDELYGLDLRQAAMNSTNLAAPGTPEYWWIEGDDTLHAWPGDGTPLTVVYIVDSPELVLPEDTPLIPRRYHGMWIDYAVCEAYKDSDNFPGAQALRQDLTLRMQDVITRYETRNRQHSPFMTVRTSNEDD